MFSQLHHNRLGEWWFRCRRCQEVGLPHYSHASAALDRLGHVRVVA